MTLEEALNSAKQNRKAILAAELKVASAKAESNALSALDGPTLGVGYSSTDGLGATDQDLYISQAIDIFGRRSANSRLGRALVASARAEYRKTLLQVQTEVLAAFYEVAATEHKVVVAKDILSIAESLLTATGRRFEEGKIPEVQVTRAKIERDRASQAKSLAEAQAKAALQHLAGAIGTEPPKGIKLSILPQPKIDLSQRPDILLLIAAAEVAKAKAGISQKSKSPTLELVGLKSPWQDDTTEFGARLQLTWNFFDFGRSQNDSKAAVDESKAHLAMVQDQLHLALSEVEAIQTELQAYNQTIASYERISSSANELVEKSQLGFQQGYGTLLDVLEASRALREIELEIIESQLASHLLLVELYQTTGTLVEVAK